MKIGVSKFIEVNWFDGIRKGGFESVVKYVDRVFLFFWIDIVGEGDYVIVMFDNYIGDIIIMIGEW